MIDPGSDRLSAVSEVFARSHAPWRSRAKGRWELNVASTGCPTAKAQLHEEWLLLEAPLTHGRDGKGLDGPALNALLRRSGALPGCVKYCLDPGERSGLVTLETPLDADGDLAAQVAAACGDFEAAISRDGDDEANEVHTKQSPKNGSSHQDAASVLREVARLSEECGWSVALRPDGRLAVQLDVVSGFFQADVQPFGAGINLSVELESRERSPLCFGATHLFLLTASRAVRMTRAGMATARGPYRWEVNFGGVPTGRQLDHALCALSVACRLTANEVIALSEESLANRFLHMRGWSSLTQRSLMPEERST